MSITYRSAGAWGAGKGAPLSPDEIDSNFWALQQVAASKETNPAQPLCIADIVPEDVTGVAIHMTDASVRRFTFPMRGFAWRGQWAPSTAYKRLDTFWHPLFGLYLVLADHTSALKFDRFETSDTEQFYQKMFGIAGMYDVVLFFPGAPGSGLIAGQPLHQFIAPRPLRFLVPGNVSTEAPSTQSYSPVYMRLAPDATLNFPLKKNGVQFGRVEVLAGHNQGSAIITDDASFMFGDVLTIGQATGTVSGSDLSITLTAVRGEPI